MWTLKSAEAFRTSLGDNMAFSLSLSFVVLLLLLSSSGFRSASGYDALLVAGGYYHQHGGDFVWRYSTRVYCIP